MSPKKWLSKEKKGRAKCSILTHPLSGKMVERPNSNQERNEIDEVLYVHCLHSREDLYSHLFDDGREHHESRAIVFKMVAGDGNGAMLRPGNVCFE